MKTWDELTLTEQVLVRRAVRGTFARGTARHVAAVLRWAGSPEVARRRYASPGEQAARVPELASATLGLVAGGWLTLRRVLGTAFVQEDGPQVVGAELEQVVADTATWVRAWDGGSDGPVLSLRATEEGRRRWEAAAYAPGTPPTIHQLDLTGDEARVRVCAMEASGWLTGPFGILADLPSGLAGEELREYVAADLAALVRFVREGRIEVLHVAEPDAEATVVPLEDLLDAFGDRDLRCEDRDDWGVGFTCVLTQSPANALR
ncbi:MULTISPECIES: hypothetical protein [unclassified Kitasatospora]|uniref:hypothetical protein n=1 Tax=unclassified Kitasatospora TaxID=2633591 RepID=UPI00070BEDB4|nr:MULTISPECIES: hypothetical protein [unclassified Kitasatospora]KQV11385.1 hypothetical protein ASC99_35980 [Kitasatospora sp. Root107]KRB66404.1 hypothetical protein ASE03_30755 [Kitasatospora sp. Root187]